MKRQNDIKLICLILFSVFLLLACNKDDENGADDDPQTAYQIRVSPEEIMLNDDETAVFSLFVQPQGEFEWSVNSKPGWMEISQSSGTINQDTIELLLTPDYTGLRSGRHFGEIEITAKEAGSTKLKLVLDVDSRPLADVKPREIIFSEGDSLKVITVLNIGTGFLNWEFQSLPPFMHMEPQSGRSYKENDVEVWVSVERAGLDPGTLVDQIMLKSNSKEGDIKIDVTLEVPELPVMTITESSINYGYFENEKSFFIRNDGNVDFNWSWDDNSNSYITVSPATGSLAKGDSIEITMAIDRTDLYSDTYNLEVFFNNNKEQTTRLPIQIKHYIEDKWIIEGSVIDAEYDKNNDVIVVVSKNPNELRVFDPSKHSVKSVALNQTPTSLSVGLNGLHAAVGHNESFSYINLSTMQIEYIYEVSANVTDIILAPNNWVYVIPERPSSIRIRCINLLNGLETQHIGMASPRLKIQLHPSGDYIYGATQNVGISDFLKYDIRNGTAEFLYRSPYNGTYAFDGDIWISENGNRLFAKSRNVFNSSSNRDNDITYVGRFEGNNTIKTMDHSSAANSIYAVFHTGSPSSETPANEIRKYDSRFLTFQGTIELPAFLIPDGSGDGNFYNSEGHFGFFNSDGTKFHVILKSGENSVMQNEWAIVTVDVE